jgi:hypothetical protein
MKGELCQIGDQQNVGDGTGSDLRQTGLYVKGLAAKRRRRGRTAAMGGVRATEGCEGGISNNESRRVTPPTVEGAFLRVSEIAVLLRARVPRPLSLKAPTTRFATPRSD